MSQRIESRFIKLKQEKRAGLITFIMAGDPDMGITSQVLDAIVEAGADMVEIGMPFSDPMADGAVIQAAGLRALKAGTKLRDILKLVADFRTRHKDTPVILMGYFNPVYRYGCERFCKDASTAGVDGLILVDLPPEEENEMRPYLDSSGLKLVRLVAPTSAGEDGVGRLPELAKSASGFMYYIAVAGITGGKSADKAELALRVSQLRRHTALPIAVGFGIKTPQQAAEVAQVADAVVVGSALVDIIAKAQDAPEAAAQFVKQLAEALQG